jgi:hypothetical protein
MKQKLTAICIFILASMFSLAFGGKKIFLSEEIWSGLLQSEKDQLSDNYDVETYEDGKYATILDVQAINKSHINNGAMAELGSLIGQANYIDSSTYSDYSVQKQLGTAILGGMIGSLADKPTVIKFHFRYTMKTPNGEVINKDVFQSSHFHQAKGLCVDSFSLEPINDEFCQKTNIVDFRKTYLSKSILTSDIESSKEAKNDPMAIDHTSGAPASETIQCKLGTNPPFSTTPEKCNLLKGVLFQ